MIIEALLNLIVGLVKLLLGWINLPDLPEPVTAALDTLFGYMGSALSLLWFFFDRNFVLACVPIVIALINFDKLYSFTMWIIRKLPIGIE